MFHLDSWALHKSRRSVCSAPAAKILAASDALNELIVLQTAIDTNHEVRTKLQTPVNSGGLYNAATTQRRSIE